MRRAMIVGMLLWAGCGTVDMQPATSPGARQALTTTKLDAIMVSCSTIPRELVLQEIEVVSTGLQLGITFGDQVDLLDGGSCGQRPRCRECMLAAIEWVYFGVLP